MAIHVDVIIDVHERELQKATRKLKREADQLGHDLSDRISKNFKGISPQALKSLDTASDQMVALRRSMVEYNKVAKDKKATDEDQLRALENLSKAVRRASSATDDFTEKNKKELKLTRQRAKIIGDNTKAFKDYRDELGRGRTEITRLRTANAGLIKDGTALSRNFKQVTEASKKASREHDRYNRMVESGTASREAMIRQSAAVRDAYERERDLIRDTTNAVARESDVFKQRSQIIADNTKAFSDANAMIHQHRTAVTQMRGAYADQIKDSNSLARSFDRVGDAQTKTTRELEKYNRMVQSGSGTRDALIRQSEAVRDSYEKERRAIRDASDAVSHHNDVIRGGGGGGGRGGRGGRGGGDLFPNSRIDNDIQGLIGSLMGLRLAGGVGAVAMAGLAAGAIELIKFTTTLTQALWLLPAAITAVGAGMGTLKLATAGFGDTIGALADGDLEKFANELQKLSPQAQQTALSIQAILPELSGLRKATQDSFFSGLGGELERLSATYLPSVQNLTTTIADAFNGMLKGVSFELIEPETQAQVQNLFDNIGLAFQNLAPAARSFTQAFIDIASAGSDFLPDLASGVADLARDFADFIREARESGNLKRWIEEGISAVGTLATALSQLVTTIYDVFGSDAQQNVKNFQGTIDNLKVGIAAIRGDFSGLGETIKNDFLNVLFGDTTNSAVRDWLYDIPEALGEFAVRMTAVLNDIGQRINENLIKPLNIFQAFLTNPVKAAWDVAHGGVKGPIPEIPNVTATSNWNDWGPARDSRDPDRNLAPGLEPGEYRDRSGRPQRIPAPPQPGSPAGQNQRDVPPGTPLGPDGKPLSEKEQLDAAMAALAPSTWKVDPYAAMPGAGPPGSSPYNTPRNGPPPGAGPYSGYYEVDPQQVLEADRKVQSEAKDLEEKRRKRLALEQSNLGSAQEVEDAKWDEVEAGWKLQEAQADLAKEQQGTWKKLTDGLEGFRSKLTAGLDADLGISKGLPGLADNLVRFIGTLAAAPLLTQLEMISEAQGGIDKTGSGLIGMAAAQGAFGPEYTPAGQLAAEMAANGLVPSGTSNGYVTASPYASSGTTTGTPPGSSYVPPDQNLQPNAARANDMIAQMFPALNDIGGWRSNGNGYRDHPSGNALDIMIPGEGGLNDPTSPGGLALGNQINEWLLANKDAIGLVSTIWQQKDHFNHIHALFSGPGSPGGEGDLAAGIPGMPGALGPGGPGAPGSVPRGSQTLNTPFGSIPIPLPVTIVNGTMPGPGGPAAPGGGGPGNAAAAMGGGGGGGGTPGANWDAIAEKESGGVWDLPNGDSDSTGGLQIQDRTWRDFGGGNISPHAYQASKEDQIRIAEKILAAQGPNAWAGGKNFVPYTPPAAPGFQGGGAVAGIGQGAGATPFKAMDPLDWIHDKMGGRSNGFNPAMRIDTSRVSTSGPPFKGGTWLEMIGALDPGGVPFGPGPYSALHMEDGGGLGDLGHADPNQSILSRFLSGTRMLKADGTPVDQVQSGVGGWKSLIPRIFGRGPGGVMPARQSIQRPEAELNALFPGHAGVGMPGGPQPWAGPRMLPGRVDKMLNPYWAATSPAGAVVTGYGALGAHLGRDYNRDVFGDKSAIGQIMSSIAPVGGNAIRAGGNLFGKADGGPIYGPGGPKSDVIPAMLSRGEHVLTAEDVQALGGQAGVYAMRAALHYGIGGAGGAPMKPPPIPPPPPRPPAPAPKPAAAGFGAAQRAMGAGPGGPGGSAGTGIMSHLPPGATPGAPIAPGPPGSPQRAGFDAAKSRIGGGDPVGIPGGGAAPAGGLAGTLTSAASMAADMFAPGSGAAVQIASQEIQRAIKFGAQATGIIAGGLMDTFLPFGGSELANNNWVTRIGGAFAGVAPQIPNIAGKSASVDDMMQHWSPPTPMAQSGFDSARAKLAVPTAPNVPPAPAPAQPPPTQVIQNTNVWNVPPNVTAREGLSQLQEAGYGGKR